MSFKILHLKKSNIAKHRILQINKCKTTLFDLLLRFLESLKIKSNFILKYFENLEKAPSKCSQESKLLVKVKIFRLLS